MAKRMEEDLSQLTSELEVVKAAVAPKSKR
jgi:hypothetical protein